MFDKINKALSTMRPYLQADGGDVELADVSDDGIVRVRLTGACATCPLNLMTLRAGIERSLMLQVPGVRRVEEVQDE